MPLHRRAVITSCWLMLGAIFNRRFVRMAQVNQALSLDPLICNTIRLSPARVPEAPGDT